MILAAGGYTSLYSRSTSRLDENLGDAPALAYRAGASLRDMEFVQFHPTGMVKPREMSGTLVTEAVRGEGGRLFNAQGDRFMERYSPGKMELEARDVVARAIFEEIRSGRGTPEKAVQLDISHKDPDFIRERLPAMYRRFQEQGIDITKEPMQVAPTAHYSMGGVKVNFETGATDVDGLFAVGEATSGLHGANRLGGNSLAETLVFGKITGTCLAASLSERPAEPRRAVEEAVERSVLAIEEAMTSKGTYDPEDLIEELRDLMWEHAGIVRSDEGLRKGIEKHEILAAKANDLSVAAGSVRDPKCEWALNLRSMLLTAETVLRGALLRTESRGAHCRDDATETDPSWEKNILYVQGKDEKMRLTTESIPPISDEVKTVLDKGAELDYHQLE